jgi:hypothetical protein
LSVKKDGEPADEFVKVDTPASKERESTGAKQGSASSSYPAEKKAQDFNKSQSQSQAQPPLPPRHPAAESAPSVPLRPTSSGGYTVPPQPAASRPTTGTSSATAAGMGSAPPSAAEERQKQETMNAAYQACELGYSPINLEGRRWDECSWQMRAKGKVSILQPKALRRCRNEGVSLD